MRKSKIKRQRRKAKANNNKKMLHDMVMKRLGRYVGNEEAIPVKTSMPQLDSEDAKSKPSFMRRIS